MTKKILIDTHILIWWLEGNKAKLKNVFSDIEDPANKIYVSPITLFEISLKKSLNKLRTPDDLLEQLENNDFKTLLFTPTHAIKSENLPWHHKDPFDRMLIAQAKFNNFIFMTADKEIWKYDLDLIKA